MCWGAGVTSATTCASLSWRGRGRPASRGGKVPGCRGPRPLAPPPPVLGPSRVCGRAPSRLAGLHSRPCVAACCGAQARGGRPVGLREPRPHLWPPALAPGAPRVAVCGFAPHPSSSPPKPLPARSLFPLPQPRESWTKESRRALGLFLAASQEPRTRGNQHPAGEWAGRLGRPPAGAAR